MENVAINERFSAGAIECPYPNVWPKVLRRVVAGATGIGLILGASSPSQAGSCEVRVTNLAQTSVTSVHEDEASALAQAELLFNRVSLAEINDQLQGVAPGDAREVTTLFEGSDARWRFVRTLKGETDPDGFVIAAEQTRWLIRPAEESLVTALLLAGFPDASTRDSVTKPVLVGLHKIEGVPHIFTVEPVNPTQCTWRVGQVTDWIDETLSR